MRVAPVKHQCSTCGQEFWELVSQKRKYCSRKCYDRMQKMQPNRGTFTQGHRKGMTGKKQPSSWYSKFSSKMKGHPFWGGESGWFKKGQRNRTEFKKGSIPWNKGKGVTPEEHLFRLTKVYSEWRMAVFERDDYTCQMCGHRGSKICADHILPYSLHPELRLALDNGRTLCSDCHRHTPTYGMGAWKAKSDIATRPGR